MFSPKSALQESTATSLEAQYANLRVVLDEAKVNLPVSAETRRAFSLPDTLERGRLPMSLITCIGSAQGALAALKNPAIVARSVGGDAHGLDFSSNVRYLEQFVRLGNELLRDMQTHEN